jgi:hypothetical protein
MTMKHLQLVLVFAAGCVTAATAGWMTSELRAQTPAPPNVVHVCAAPEGTLRVTPLRSLCPAGQQSMFFRRSAEAPPDQPPDETPGTTDARVKALERRIAELEGQAARTGLTRRVPAPFEVMDRTGKRVFSVSEDRDATLYSAAGDGLVRFGARNTGGFVMARPSAGSQRVLISADGSESGLQITEGDAIRARIGTKGDGDYRMMVFSKDGKTPVAALGEMQQRGAAVIFDQAGERAGMYAEEGTGHVVVYNKQVIPVAMLTEGKTAGGLFVLTSSSGERMVAAGVQPEGFGVVQAGPASFMQAAGLGLPGSYIAGKPK